MAEIKTPVAKGDEDIHTEAIERFHLVENKEKDNREQSISDIVFAQVAGGQYQDNAGVDDSDERPDRPRFEINTIASAIDTVIGNQRQNDISINVFQTGQGPNPDAASLIDGIIRNIEYQSKARNIYDSAFDEALNGGYGGFRIISQFIDGGFDQECRIKPVNSATSSMWFDVNANEYDKSDARWAFLTFSMNLKDFEATYPDASVSGFQQDNFNNSGSNLFTWRDGQNIRIAEYWRKVPTKRHIYLISNGAIWADLDDQKIELINSGGLEDDKTGQIISIVRDREEETMRVERYLMNGVEILEPMQPEPDHFIPLVPVYGKVTYVEEQEYVRGVVRFARDPARMYNFTRSAILEKTSLAPNDPYWMTTVQGEGHHLQNSRLNIENPPVAFFKSDPEHPEKPGRTGAVQVDQALIEAASTAQRDISLTLGITATQPLLDGIDRRSAEAVNAQQRIGDTGTFVFTDNLTKSIEYGGRMLASRIPITYDTERMTRIVGADGEGKMVQINSNDENDIRQGKFDVIVKTGPAFASMREKAADLLEVLSQNPIFAALTPDLLADNLDLPPETAKEMKRRVRKRMIMDGIAEGDEEELAELGISQEQQITAKITPQIREQVLAEGNNRFLLSEAAKNEADAEKTMRDIKSADVKDQKMLADADLTQNRVISEAIDGMKKMVEGFILQQEAGIPLSVMDHDNRIQQQDLIEESQDIVSPGPTSEQDVEFNLPPQ